MSNDKPNFVPARFVLHWRFRAAADHRVRGRGGTIASSAWVYGWLGVLKISSADAVSTTRREYLTMTRSALRFTTPRSCEMITHVKLRSARKDNKQVDHISLDRDVAKPIGAGPAI